MKGGYRQNAGRKKGFAAKNAEEARKLLSERLAEEIGPITEALISGAKKGDIKAIKELFDRAWGRPPQAIQTLGDNKLNISFDSAFRYGLTNGESEKQAEKVISRYLEQRA